MGSAFGGFMCLVWKTVSRGSAVSASPRETSPLRIYGATIFSRSLASANTTGVAVISSPSA